MDTPDRPIRIISHRKQPWAWFDKRVVRVYGRQLGPHGLAVYMCLAMHADGETQTCFPSYQTIAQEIGVSRPTVVKAIAQLCALQLISKVPMVSPDGDAGPNCYALLDVPPLDELSTGNHPVVNEVNHPSQPGLPRVVNDVDTNKNQGERDSENKKRDHQQSSQITGKRPLHQQQTADVNAARAYARHLLASGE